MFHSSDSTKEDTNAKYCQIRESMLSGDLPLFFNKMKVHWLVQ